MQVLRRQASVWKAEACGGEEGNSPMTSDAASESRCAARR
jgi:hypothetical protein